MGITRMAHTDYVHVVEYDKAENKITIYRLLGSGKRNFYTEIPIGEIAAADKNLEGVGRILGGALVLDMVHLRDTVGN